MGQNNIWGTFQKNKTKVFNMVPFDGSCTFGAVSSYTVGVGAHFELVLNCKKKDICFP